MKTFAEALLVLACDPTDTVTGIGTDLSLEVKNLLDIHKEAGDCNDFYEYLEAAIEEVSSTGKFSELSMPNKIYCIASTFFLSGVRVGMEMEKQ